MNNKRDQWKLSKYLQNNNFVIEIRCISHDENYRNWVNLLNIRVIDDEKDKYYIFKDIVRSLRGKIIPIDTYINRIGTLSISYPQIKNDLNLFYHKNNKNYKNIFIQFIFSDINKDTKCINLKIHQLNSIYKGCRKEQDKKKIHFF